MILYVDLSYECEIIYTIIDLINNTWNLFCLCCYRKMIPINDYFMNFFFLIFFVIDCVIDFFLIYTKMKNKKRWVFFVLLFMWAIWYTHNWKKIKEREKGLKNLNEWNMSPNEQCFCMVDVLRECEENKRIEELGVSNCNASY